MGCQEGGSGQAWRALRGKSGCGMPIILLASFYPNTKCQCWVTWQYGVASVGSHGSGQGHASVGSHGVYATMGRAPSTGVMWGTMPVGETMAARLQGPAALVSPALGMACFLSAKIRACTAPLTLAAHSLWCTVLQARRVDMYGMHSAVQGSEGPYCHVPQARRVEVEATELAEEAAPIGVWVRS